MIYAEGDTGEHHEERPDIACRSRALSVSTTRRCSSSPTTRSRSRTITRRSPAMPMPMDIEWAKDGEDGQLYIVQARPETVASQRAPSSFETYTLDEHRSGPRQRQGGRREDRHRQGPRHRPTRASSRISGPARCWSRIPQPRLGAGDEDGRRHRHQSRRPNLPCRHRRTRTRRSGGGRRRGRHRAARDRRERDRFLRRRRNRHRLCRQPALRGEPSRRPERSNGRARRSWSISAIRIWRFEPR